MQRVVSSILAMLLVGLIGGVYASYRRAYDPERICANQTDLPPEQCAANIRLAQSAGW